MDLRLDEEHLLYSWGTRWKKGHHCLELLYLVRWPPTHLGGRLTKPIPGDLTSTQSNPPDQKHLKAIIGWPDEHDFSYSWSLQEGRSPGAWLVITHLHPNLFLILYLVIVSPFQLPCMNFMVFLVIFEEPSECLQQFSFMIFLSLVSLSVLLSGYSLIPV